MYTEGIKVGNNSCVLASDDGTLRILSGDGTPEEIEKYINLKNEYEEKSNEYCALHNRLTELYEFDKSAKKADISTSLSTLSIGGLFITLDLLFNVFPLALLITVPVIGISSGIISKIVVYGTKKQRIKQKEQIKNNLITKEKEIYSLADEMFKLYQKIDCQEVVIDEKEDEIIPITTVENKKANVKMRILKLK